MSRHAKATSHHPVRHDRLIQEQEHDPYATARHGEAAFCPHCSASFHGGRWRWGAAEPGATARVCPACRRIRDKYPAGLVLIGGDFGPTEKEECLHLIEHEAAAEGANHPLERIMTLEEEDGTLVLTTTSVHLARRIGEALQRAHRGRLDVHYGEDERFVRVRFWH